MIQCLNIYYWDLLTVGSLSTVVRSGIFIICQRQSFSAKMHIFFSTLSNIHIFQLLANFANSYFNLSIVLFSEILEKIIYNLKIKESFLGQEKVYI